ncbi:NAD(P)H-binding protein [Pendulispora rubella]|uniref:NAD(P)H-binding protein n=1 Tax=Pendulispora rubella TaxID=2741070 RepID=A0ABZ2L641_9BACT
MKYLVTGATGAVGSLVVERLLARGERPRVFVRSAEKARSLFGDQVDVATGDLADGASLAAALRGIDRAFLVNSGPDLAARDGMAAQAARTAGLGHLVKLSTMDVEQGVGTGPRHARGEAAIRAHGVGFTFVRPSGFMVNALAWAPAIQAGGVVLGATGTGKIAFIHAHDIADVATAALTSTRYDGESLAISGPEALCYGEMVAKIGAAIGRSLAFESISEEEERRRWQSWGESEESIDYHMSIFGAIRDGSLACVTDTVERVTGRPARTFDQWARENATAFH